MTRVCKHPSKCVRIIIKDLRRIGAEVDPPMMDRRVSLDWRLAGRRMHYPFACSGSQEQAVKAARNHIRHLLRQAGLTDFLPSVPA